MTAKSTIARRPRSWLAAGILLALLGCATKAPPVTKASPAFQAHVEATRVEPPPTRGRVYRVDPIGGDDARSGLAGDGTPGGGPWRTLGRVGRQELQPGDTVELLCGGVWHETLTIRQSGTPENPVTIRAAPDCPSDRPPTIDATETTKLQWQPYSDAVFVADIDARIARVFLDGVPLALAHFPSRGESMDQERGDYLIVPTKPSAKNRIPVSKAFVDRVLAKGMNLAGSRVHARVLQWYIDDGEDGEGTKIALDVVSFDHERAELVLSRDIRYGPVAPHTGFYLDNQLWMLSHPGEWFYDSLKGRLYVSTPDGKSPGAFLNRVAVTLRRQDANGNWPEPVGIDAVGVHDVEIANIAIVGTGTGVALRKARAVNVRGLTIRHASKWAIDMSYASDIHVSGCTIENTGREAIWATDASGLTIDRNQVLQTAMGPMPTFAWCAICVGQGASDKATVRDNRIVGSGYGGITTPANSLVSRNYLRDICMRLDDCGAMGTGHDSRLIENIIQNLPGDIHGQTGHTATQAFYFDEKVGGGVEVAGNTVIGADDAVQVLASVGSYIHDNTFYGNRKSQIWFQEFNCPTCETVRNRVERNVFFPFSDSSSILEQRYSNKDVSFASYSANVHSNIFGGHRFVRRDQSSGRDLTRHIQSGSATADTQQDRATRPFVVVPFRYSPASGNLLTTAAAATGGRSWLIAGAGTTVQSTTTPVELRPNTTYVLLIRQEKGGTGSLRVAVAVQDGGATWAPSPTDVASRPGTTPIVLQTGPGTSPKRASIVVSAKSEQGTIQLRLPSLFEASVSYSNAREIAPILLNESTGLALVNCPTDATNQAATCGEYLGFPNGEHVAFPVALPSFGSKIVIWSGTRFKDSDDDGVPDDADKCPSTPLGQIVDVYGCEDSD